jgi:peptidoglycan glycosyltransferase
VNTSVVRLFAGVLVLFAALVVATSWWTVVDAEELRAKPENRRVLLAEERIKRGVIRSADGEVLAGSRPLSGDRFARRYPTGPLMAHPVGCTSLERGRSGIEDYYNDALTGRRTELIGAIDSLLGPDEIGDDLRMTLHTRAQEVAVRGLDGRREKGAVVALDVKSGAVRVLAAKPTFDPERDDCGATLNLATQGRFPPGSTMKTVTATAALDSGRYQPDSTVSGANGKEISGAPLNNFGNEDFGQISLTDALTNSVNTVWAEVAEKVGKDTMAEYMDRFGFYADPPMDYPDRQMVPSGVDKGRGGLVRPTSDRVDIGRVGIGQGDLQVTPLQMATVAQTIGNGGVRMEPRLVEKVVDPDGRTMDEPLPEEAQRVMSAETAAKLTDMMRKVVEEGTGTAAALEGVQVAGKTGTAELNLQGLNEAWFIGFTDEVAVAVVVDRVQGGTGGEIAAPIAKAVLEALGE